MIPVKPPKEVLNLFPTWEYCCPNCSTYVESDKSFCPNCKAPFDEKKWRVPPRFLKSHDAMSEYAHNVLAPKLTPKQRELLFQYFTELFNDGFESGDFSAWTRTNISGAGSALIVEDVNPHHGTYNAKMTASALGALVYCIKTFTATDPVFARYYVKFDTLALGADGNRIEILKIDSGVWQYATAAMVRRLDGVLYWGIVTFEAGTGTYVSSAVTPTTGRWYCLDLKRDVANNLQEIWVDEVSLVTRTVSITNDTARVRAGLTFLDSSTLNVNFFDCVVVADTYIGPETMEQTYTKTWTTDAIFKKLGIPKTLSVDVTFQKQNLPKIFGIDADFLKKDVIKSFAVGTRFGALMTQTISRQIDILLKKMDATKSFGVDIYFGAVEAETYAKSFGLGVIFAYKVRLPELWLDENGKIVLNISKPYTWVGT